MFPTSIFDELELEAFPPFIYTPLTSPEHTRLIKIRPAWNRTDLIQFTLEEAPIESLPRYTAISYTWGRQKPDHIVLCNGKTMLITTNARDALQRLRRRTQASRSSHFWLDAICIDQSSMIEKANQVTRMSSIYKNAQSVAVWLGVPDPEACTPGWDKLHALYSRRDIFARRSQMQWSRHGSRTFTLAKTLLTENEYWTRVWTVQEMALSTSCELYIGEYRSMPATNVARMPLSVREGFVAHLGRAHDDHDPADRLAITLLKHSAQEPLDYVYGLRAIYPDILGNIDVDYSRSAVSLFAQVARQIIEHGGWRLIFTARHRNKRAGCPSWVPDWSSSAKSAWWLHAMDVPMYGELFHAAQFSNDNLSLALHGVRLGKVVASSSPDYFQQHAPCTACVTDHLMQACVCHIWCYFRHWLHLCDTFGLKRESGDNVLGHTISDHRDSLARLLCENSRGPKYLMLDDLPEILQHLRGLSSICCGDQLASRLREGEETILNWLRQRHFFLLDGGIMGVALLSSGVHTGDLIVQFDNSRDRPHFFVVHPIVQDGCTRYEFLGWVYFVDRLNSDPSWATELFDMV